VFYFVTAIGFLIALVAISSFQRPESMLRLSAAFPTIGLFRFAPLSALLRPRCPHRLRHGHLHGRGQCIVVPNEGGAASVGNGIRAVFCNDPSSASWQEL